MGLAPGTGELEPFGEALQSGAFPSGEPSRAVAGLRNEDFFGVLAVFGEHGSGWFVQAGHREAEHVAPLHVLAQMAVQEGPGAGGYLVVGQIVPGFQDVAHDFFLAVPGFWKSEVGALGVQAFRNGHDVNPHPLLRHMVAGVEGGMEYVVARLLQFLGEFHEGLAALHKLKILHVFQQEGFRAVVLGDPDKLHVEPTVFLVLGADSVAQFLPCPNAREAKGLARKTAHYHIVFGNFGSGDFGYVSRRFVAEVVGIGLAGKLVDF